MLDYNKNSLATQVHKELERMVLSGELKRGEIVHESELSNRLGVSRTPIREALKRLEENRLIRTENNTKVVVGITLEDIRDLYLIRLKLEPEAAVSVIDNLTDDDLAKIKEMVEYQEFCIIKNNLEKVKDLDAEFHQFIYARCGRPMLEETLRKAYKWTMKYRRASYSNEERKKETCLEHRAIYNALMNRDKEETRKIVEKHIKKSLESITGDRL